MTPPSPGTPPDPRVPTPPAQEPAQEALPAAPGAVTPGTAPQAAHAPLRPATDATRHPAAPQAGAPHAPAAAPVPAAGTPDASTAAPPVTPGLLWTRARGFLVALAVLLAAGLTLAALNSGAKHGYLDPRSADPFGSRAVAELLDAHGVTTRVVTTAEEAADATGPDTTLLVADPDRLGEGKLRAIRSAIDLSGGRTVLLAPSTPSLPDLAPGTRTHDSGTSPETNLDPGTCALPAAASAGRAATGGGYRYTTTTPGAVGCYPSAGHPTLLVLPTATPGGDTVLLGSETVLLNKTLAKEGNASLALQLLGSRPHLVWYLPSLADSGPDDTDDREEDFLALIPAGWSWALLQLFVAAALAALWRARRLGPLVTENLPVLIRASEATEGRARLYRKAGARDRAATVLRAAARERLAALVGVPASQAHDPASLVPAVSARLTAGDPATATHRPGDPAALLFGTIPDTDAALVALADQLDALEREVRTS
ncbi:DUF4350 domain-containing protein [Streptomyces sp. NPDC060048]|uniref:DUF4350 domain-containing protein n=1 Tax=unclassified Streptomyces TaxID=2593676 RepID=UPI003681B39C